MRVGRALYLAPLVPLVGRGEARSSLSSAASAGSSTCCGAGGSRRSPTTRRSSRGSTTRAVGRSHGFSDTSRRSCTTISRRSRKSSTAQPAPARATGRRHLLGETRADFDDLLSKDAAAAIVGWTHAEAHAGSELLGLATPVLSVGVQSRSRRFRRQARKRAERRAAAGRGQTLEAASDGRVDLLFQDGVDHSAARCPRCGRVASRGREVPTDGTSMERSDEGSTSPFTSSSTAGRSGPCSIAWISSPSRGSARSCDTDGVPSLARNILEEHLFGASFVLGTEIGLRVDIRRLPRTPPGRWR